jgi:hypothetical protein
MHASQEQKHAIPEAKGLKRLYPAPNLLKCQAPQEQRKVTAQVPARNPVFAAVTFAGTTAMDGGSARIAGSKCTRTPA